MNIKSIIPILAFAATISCAPSILVYQDPSTTGYCYTKQNGPIEYGSLSFSISDRSVEELHLNFFTTAVASDNGLIQYYHSGDPGNNYDGHNLLVVSHWLSSTTEAYHPSNACQHEVEGSKLQLMIDNKHNARYTYRIGDMVGEGTMKCEVY